MKRFSTLALLLLGACATATPPAPIEDAPALHERLLVLDTHLDTPLHFGRPGWSFGDRHDPATDIAQVDMGRMEEGALDGGFFVIYTDQGPLTAKGYADALAFARGRSDVIDTTIAQFPRRIAPALTAQDARRLNGENRLIAFKSIENSYPLGEDLSLLAEFHRRGVRMAGPVHGKNNQFADSSTDTPRWNGLSPLGRQWVAEMNRLGMVIDASHSSDAVFDQLLDLSRAPIILSHTTGRHAYDHPRNLDDARIRALAAKGGAMCISTIFLSELNLAGERGALFAKYEQIATLPPAQQVALAKRWRELDKTQPLWDADFEKYMAMVLHVVKVAGPDHVCFSGDWDGGGGVKGFEDISALPLVTARLKAAGYSDDDLAKMWGGNILRIVEAAKAKAGG